MIFYSYVCDMLGRLLTRSTSRNGTTQNDTFGYNARSELTAAALGCDNYAYAFDHIGNRTSATETATTLAYTANALNQYSEITSSESSASFAFNPVYDAARERDADSNLHGNVANYLQRRKSSDSL